MARSDSKQDSTSTAPTTQEQHTQSVLPTTSTTDVDARAAALAKKEQELKQREEEFARRVSQSSTREKDLERREQLVDLQSTRTALSSQPEDIQFVDVINTGRRAIGLPGGILLTPGRHKEVPIQSWRQLFNADGTPSLGASEYFTGKNGAQPELVEVSLRRLPHLPDDIALEAVQGAQNPDPMLMRNLAELDTRPSIREALKERVQKDEAAKRRADEEAKARAGR